MRVLCTGGAGYIGSVVVSHLLSAGHEVVVLDNLVRGHRDAVPEDVRLVHADVRDLDALLSAFEAPVDAVVHLADLASVEESRRDPLDYYANNTVGLLKLSQVVAMTKCPRIIYASSCSVYGSCRLAVEDESPLCPESPYAETKVVSEKILRALREQQGTSVGILRLFNVAGAFADLSAGERHSLETHLIPRILQAALRDEPFTINGQDHDTLDGTCVRDYVHVDDVARAFVTILHALRPNDHRVYNVGSGLGTSVREMVEIAEKITDKAILTTVAARRPGDPGKICASIRKIKRELGWCPVGNASDMVYSAWAFMQKNLEQP